MKALQVRRPLRIVVVAAAAMALAMMTLVAPSMAHAAGGLYIDTQSGDLTDVLPGTTAMQRLGVGNEGGPEVEITSVTLDDPTGLFTMDASGCLGQTLPGTVIECPLDVTFSPMATGTYTATLTVTSTGGTWVGPITGTSSDPFVRLWVEPSVDFGVVPVGESQTQTVGVSNQGNVAATVSLFVQNEQDSFSAPETVEVPAKGGVAVDLTFNPTHLYGSETGLVWSYGTDTWLTTMTGVAYTKAGDDQDTATPIVGELPFQLQDAAYLDWATTSFVESDCAMTRGIWYKYTAPIDSVVQYVFGSDFPVMVGESMSGGGGCGGPEQNATHTARVMAGETLYMFVGPSTQYGYGGHGVIYLNADVRPLVHIGLTTSTKGTINHAGTVTIKGTASSDPAVDILVHAVVSQKSGHGFVTAEHLVGYFDQSGRLNWSMPLIPSAGKFVAGPVQVEVDAFNATGEVFGTHPSVRTTVKLAGGSKT